MKTYPRPDWKFFFKNTGGMILFLGFLHWIPEIATWIQANLTGETLLIDERRFRMILIVAYAMTGIAFLIHVTGLTWAWWHNRGR